MSSIVEICNMGLTLIGDQVISSLDDENDRAVVANLFYEPTRDAVLRAHPWSFAKYRKELAEASGAPEFGWQYHFALPITPKCLRVLSVDENYPGQIPYAIEGRKLLTDSDVISILYIAQMTDSGVFDALFVDCLAARLAAAFAMALTKQKTLIDLAMGVYNQKIAEARMIDGLEAEKKEIHNTTLSGVR
jgi:hypothetical protein